MDLTRAVLILQKLQPPARKLIFRVGMPSGVTAAWERALALRSKFPFISVVLVFTANSDVMQSQHKECYA